jgi:hypothetical protein
MANNRISLNGVQIAALLDFTDRELDAQITLGHFDDRRPDSEGNPMPAGLYAWFTEYPEEGAIYLGDADTNCSQQLERNAGLPGNTLHQMADGTRVRIARSDVSEFEKTTIDPARAEAILANCNQVVRMKLTD